MHELQVFSVTGWPGTALTLGFDSSECGEGGGE